ncbi:MAG TPA: hypothetical protein VFJ85_14105 [Acidimicrobiales bacterium]|nr:hypothetical protein [Acidimicrobiales bacterium]
MAILGHVADDRDQLAARLDRIEEMLRRLNRPAGGDGRNARSVAGRLDDVWVAVTEGNERVVAAVERLGEDRTGASAGDTEATVVHLRLNRIEETLAAIAQRLVAPGWVPPVDGTGLEAEVRRLAERVDALAQALEGPAADASPSPRLTRLRDQFRRP